MEQQLEHRRQSLSEAVRLLADPEARLRSLYWIKNKQGEAIRFVPNWTQEHFLSEMWYLNVILKARQLGFCLEPSTRVLTADLRWLPIGDLQPGQEIVSVDEDIPGGRGASRKMRTGIIHAVVKVSRPAYRLSFDDGRSVVCTGQHPWLSRKVATDSSWRAIESPPVTVRRWGGHGQQNKLVVGTAVRFITSPWGEPSVEDGWFGGMLDGEGSISNGNSPGASVNVSQLRGPVWDRMIRYCHERGYNFRIEADKPERRTKYGKHPVPKVVIGRMDELFRLIGQTRPTRFLGKRWWEGRELPGKKSGVGWAKIVAIEPLGTRPMIDLQTSTGTYIAEGFVSHNTTLITLYMLDACLFYPNVQAGIIADTDDKAKEIFRDKVRFAYDHLPPNSRRARETVVESEHRLEFDNGSSFSVGTSMRGTTKQYLLVSELGKIAAESPTKADEIRTGSFNTVHAGQFLCVESTAKGREGLFYDICEVARQDQQTRRELTQLSFKFHFYPWYLDESYTLPTAIAKQVGLTKEDRKYFAGIEEEMGVELSPEQRAWYVEKRRTQKDDMKAEFPSTPNEAFEVSGEGRIYRREMAKLREEGRLLERVPVIPNIPVNSFWDIGGAGIGGDFMSIWMHQRVGPENRLVRYIEDQGYGLERYINEMRGFNFLLGKFYLPHDAGHKRLTGKMQGTSVEQMLNDMGIRDTEVVPVVENKWHDGIGATRAFLASCVIDSTHCAKGVLRLDNYKKEWNERLVCWKDHPAHDDASHGADALETGARGFNPPATRPKRNEERDYQVGKRRNQRRTYKTV